MRRMKITYSYDGSAFSGSQKQPKLRTVQGEIEEVLNRIEKTPIALVPSGRTDIYVHGLLQVAHFDIYLETIDPKNIQSMFDRQLPSDIRVYQVEEVSKDFHARYGAKTKTYFYRFKALDKTERSPFDARYYSYIPESFDIQRMNEILAEYEGIHNFTAFTVTPRRAKHIEYVKEIEACYCEYIEELSCYQFTIRGNGFLQYMIRIIIGFAFDIYNGKEEQTKIQELFATRDKEYIHAKADPQGLYLAELTYE